jgi:hypothetical protein
MAETIPAALEGLRPLREGYEPQSSGALESEVDDGPPKARRQFTLEIEQTAVRFLMTASVYEDTFRPFYETTLKRGALWFDWTEPFTGDAVTAQFIGSAAPRAKKRPSGKIEVTAALRFKR